MTLEAEEIKRSAELFLAKWPDLSHLKVRVRGKTLTLESIDDDGIVYPHARFKRKSIHKWFLEMPVKAGWEFTFIEGTIPELLTLLVEKFPWALSIR